MMRVIVAGLGVQGRKRLAIAGADAVATVDPVAPEARHRRIEDVPPGAYRRGARLHPRQRQAPAPHLPARPRQARARGEASHRGKRCGARRLRELAVANRAVCYTAYNHRFEPHIVRLKGVLDSGVLGRGTWRSSSRERDRARRAQLRMARPGDGRLPGPGLASSRLDAVSLRGACHARRGLEERPLRNKASDHFHFGFRGNAPELDFEMTLLSWRNTFRCDVFAERGSAHIDCLCKWGPSTFTLRKRVLPTAGLGRRSETLACPDPTWKAENDHFLGLCRAPSNNIDNDIWIQRGV